MGRCGQTKRRGGEPRSIIGSHIQLASLIQTLAVANHLSFSHAADALGTSQSSVSARIKTLEENLGILLFERNTRGVRLTESGRLFVERISIGIDQLELAVKTARMAASGECGRLRIGVHALIPRSFLAGLVGQYREKYSSIEIGITESAAHDAIRQLRTDRLDIVFIAGAPEFPDCHSRRIWTEQLMAVLPEHHKLARQSTITWGDLAKETFLVRYGGTGPQVFNHIVVRLAGRWSSPSIHQFDVGRGTLLAMVGQGFGVTIVSAATSLLPAPNVVFIPFADEPEPIPFSAVWLPSNSSTTLRKLLSLARKKDSLLRQPIIPKVWVRDEPS